MPRIFQIDDHYPFGLLHDDQAAARGQDLQFGYTGKELVELGNLDWMDYGARWYDPALARWGVVDPLGELTNAFNSYVYVYNNPLLFNDPTGMVGECTLCGSGESTYSSKSSNEGFQGIREDFLKEVANARAEREIDKKLASYYEWIPTAGEEVGRHITSDRVKIQYEGGWRLKSRAKYYIGGSEPSGSIGSVEDNWLGHVKRSGAAGKFLYDLLDPMAVTAQSFFRIKSNIVHLDGTGANQFDLNRAVLYTAATFTPWARGTKVVSSVMPAGLGFKKLSASMFSSRFKGTFLAGMRPVNRGRMNRLYNLGAVKGTGWLNNGGAGVMIAKFGEDE